MNPDEKLGIRTATKAASAIIGVAAGKAKQAFGEAFTNVRRTVVSEAIAFAKGFSCEETSRNSELYTKPASELVQELYCKNNNKGKGRTNNTFTDNDKKDLMNLLNVTKRANGTGFKAFTDKGFAKIGENASNAIKAATITQGVANLVTDSVVDIYNVAKSTSKDGLRQANAALKSDVILDTEN